MVVQKLRLHQFRSYEEFETDFSKHINVIVGPNGSGKTNILEALYVLLQGRSFRDGDSELIEHTKEWWRLEATMEDVVRELRYQPTESRSKQLFIDGSDKGRFSYRQQLPLVLFEPDDLLMIHSGPNSRREYLDNLLQRLYPQMRPLFSRYDRALAQRNNLLKQHLAPATLKDAVFVWDISLSETGAQILAARHQLVRDFNAVLGKTYSQLAGSTQQLQLTYQQAGFKKETSQNNQLVQALSQSLPADRQRGATSIGPHRDDVDVLLNTKSAKQTASRGEVRTILLSLKFAELELLKKATGVAPLLLLDDVFSELDSNRRKTLTKTISKYQTFITTTDADVARRTFQKNCKFITLEAK